eukprot:COSAG05_NODE_1227_length_5452_cov_12.619279_3_plen_654_part_00
MVLLPDPEPVATEAAKPREPAALRESIQRKIQHAEAVLIPTLTEKIDTTAAHGEPPSDAAVVGTEVGAGVAGGWAGDGPMPLQVMAALGGLPTEPEPEPEVPPVMNSVSAPQLAGLAQPEVAAVGPTGAPPVDAAHQLIKLPQSMGLLLELESDGGQNPAVIYTDLLRDYSRFLTELGEVASDGTASEGTLRALDMLDESAHDLLLELDAGVEAITAAAAAKKMHERRHELTQQQALLQALQSSTREPGLSDQAMLRQPGDSPPIGGLNAAPRAHGAWLEGDPTTQPPRKPDNANQPQNRSGAGTWSTSAVQNDSTSNSNNGSASSTSNDSSSFGGSANGSPELTGAGHHRTGGAAPTSSSTPMSATSKFTALTSAPGRSRMRADRQQKRSARSLAMAGQAVNSKGTRSHGSNSNATRSLGNKARDNLNTRTSRTLGSIPSDRRASANPKMLTKKMVMQELLLQMHKKWRTMNYVPQRPRKDMQIGGEFGTSSGVGTHSVDIPLTAHSSSSADLDASGRYGQSSSRSGSGFMGPTRRQRPKASTVRRAAELIESKAVKYEQVMGRMKLAYNQGGKTGSTSRRRATQPIQANRSRSRRTTRGHTGGSSGTPQRKAGAAGNRVVPLSPYKISNPSDPLGILSRSGGGMRAGPIAS